MWYKLSYAKLQKMDLGKCDTLGLVLEEKIKTKIDSKIPYNETIVYCGQQDG